MQIKKKADIHFILENFDSLAQWDVQGNKFYLVFEDRNRGGQWTLMKYKMSERFSVHGLGEDYNDSDELFFDNQENVVSFLWDNRAGYNAAIKKISTTYTINYTKLASETI